MIDRLSKAMKGDGKGAGPLADLINNSTNALSGNGELMTSSLDELSKALRLSADGGAMTRDQLTKIVTRLSSLKRRHAMTRTSVSFPRRCGSYPRCSTRNSWVPAPPASN